MVKFVGRMTGLIGGFITDGVHGALESLKFSLALMTGNPFIIAATVGSDFVNTFLKHGPKVPTATPSVFRQAVSDSFIIYGERRVGGLMVFYHPRKSSGKHYRYFVIAVAGHRCQGVTKWMLNDEEVTVDGSNKVTSGTYANKAWLWFQRGLASETANATFVSECGGKWTSAHKGNGIAAIYAKFELNDDLVEAGMPNITAVIEGRDEIFDFRDDTTGYSRNAILCAYDWLAIPREDGGYGAYADEIPDAAYISAQANVCDEDVGGEPRYAIDGVIVTGATPSEVRDSFIANMAGAHTYSSGKHLLRPGYWVPVSETLSESDFAGALQVSPFLTSDAAVNEVQGTYVDAATGYQSAAFATQTTDPAPSDIRQGNLELAFTTSKNQAERIAAIAVRRGEYEKTVTCPLSVAGLKVQALDTIGIDTERYGLDRYSFQVTGWSLSTDMNILITAREENEEIYGEPSPATPDTIPEIDVAEIVLLNRDVSVLIANSWTEPTYIMSAVESGGSVALTVADHTRVYPDGLRTSITGATFPGLDPNTAYIPYYDDITRVDTTPTIVINEDISTAQYGVEPGRHSLGRILTPDTGTAETFVGGGVYPTGSTIGAEIL